MWFKYSSPQAFYPLAGRLIPWFATLAAILCAAGLYLGLFVAPTDAQQGEAYRISRPMITTTTSSSSSVKPHACAALRTRVFLRPRCNRKKSGAPMNCSSL